MPIIQDPGADILIQTQVPDVDQCYSKKICRALEDLGFLLSVENKEDGKSNNHQDWEYPHALQSNAGIILFKDLTHYRHEHGC